MSLDVAGTRPDGLHEVDLVLCRLGGGDDLDLQRSAGADRCVVEGMADAPDNLVRRALALVAAVAGGPLGVQARLVKRLPVAAGLGGGSADAAAVLRWAARHWPTHAAALLGRAGELGADVPFLASGLPAARARGRGDDVEPLPRPTGWLVLAHPPIPVSTEDVYRAYDRVGAGAPATTAAVVDAIRRGMLPLQMGNQLERAAWHVAPGLRDFRDALERLGSPPARTVLSGTGGTYVVWLSDGDEAARLAARAAQIADWCAVHGPSDPVDDDGG